jgi:prepilin-type N-terminal cleavage/methylation domain-containing protein
MQERTLKFVLTPLDKGAPATGAGANPFVAPSPATKRGFTLIEMLVVVAIVALLAVFGIPAVRTMVNSFHSDGNTRAMINSALACARAIAMKEQDYAGIRFQKLYLANDPDLLNAPQYMIFIIHDVNATQLAPGFRAVEGMEPIKLPESVGVMDLRIRNGAVNDSADTAVDNFNISNADGLRNATTFSIVFSSSGKLIMEDARVRNRDGKGNINNSSNDDIFNTQINVENNNRGMFYQDDYTALGLGQERSRNSFIIYDANILKRTAFNNRWNGYLSTLQPIYVNPYTGSIINNR